MGKLLHQIGWSHRKPDRRAVEPDEAGIAEWKRSVWPRVKKRLKAGSSSRLHRRIGLPRSHSYVHASSTRNSTLSYRDRCITYASVYKVPPQDPLSVPPGAHSGGISVTSGPSFEPTGLRPGAHSGGISVTSGPSFEPTGLRPGARTIALFFYLILFL